jgi:hypothetical protein
VRKEKTTLESPLSLALDSTLAPLWSEFELRLKALEEDNLRLKVIERDYQQVLESVQAAQESVRLLLKLIILLLI